MKTVFLGTSDFAVPVLRALVGSEHAPSHVVTAPDRPRGRGRRVDRSPVAKCAEELGLTLFQPENINAPEATERLGAEKPELIVVVAYGQILRRPILEMASRAIVNLHGSLLPAYRGAAPIARAIQAGLPRTGVSLQHVVRAVDAGDVIDSESMAIEPGETAGELSARMSELAAELLMRNLPRLADGTAPRLAQNDEEATFAPMLAKDEGRVDWGKAATRVHDHVRAMTPWPSAYTEWRQNEDQPPERLILRRTEVVAPSPPGDEAPGTVLTTDGSLRVRTGDGGALSILRLLRSGRKESDWDAFLRGAALRPGERLQ